MTHTITNCSVCKQPLTGEDSAKYYPFCSKHCQNKDLGNWVFEKYRVASDEKIITEDGEEE